MIDNLGRLLLSRLFYLSHPSVAGLECSIVLYNWGLINAVALSTNTDTTVLFDNIVVEIIELVGNEYSNVTIRENCIILFKNETAMKLLNILFTNNETHALYPLYLKWVEKFIQ